MHINSFICIRIHLILHVQCSHNYSTFMELSTMYGNAVYFHRKSIDIVGWGGIASDYVVSEIYALHFHVTIYTWLQLVLFKTKKNVNFSHVRAPSKQYQLIVERASRAQKVHSPILQFLCSFHVYYIFLFIFFLVLFFFSYFCHIRAHVRVFVSVYQAHFHVAYVPDKYVSALLEYMKMHIFILSSRIIGVNSMSWVHCIYSNALKMVFVCDCCCTNDSANCI